MRFDSDGREPKKMPLSQATGKKKLAVTLPLIFVGGILLLKNIPGGGALILLPGAYALVGLIEIVGGKSLSDASKNWDHQPKWRKFLIGGAVIGGLIATFCLLLPIIAGS